MTSVALRFQILLVCVLLGAYLLILSPAPDSTDATAMTAVAASWVRSGSPNMNGVAFTDAQMLSPMGYVGSLGADGAVYAKKGVTPSIFLVPLVLLANALPWLTTRTTVMLLNPLVITATALLLFRFLLLLGYRLRTAFVIAITLGLATFVFAYAKTLFGEPLAGLLLLTMVMSIYRSGSARSMIIAGSAVGLLMGINLIYGVFAPLIALLILWRWRSLRTVIVYGLPIVMALLLLGLFNQMRFGSPLSSGYHLAEGEGFTVPLLTGLYGLFLSPYRGMFLYSPVLLLALPGGWLLRKQRWLLATILALVIAEALAFASWWSWHGGVVWAPRFLVPVLPLLMIALAPVVEAMWRRKWLLTLFGALFLLSALITFLGAFYNVGIYLNQLYGQYGTTDFQSIVSGYKDEVLYNPALSPILGHLAMLLAGKPFDPGWLQTGDWSYLLIPGALIGLGVVQFFIRLARRLRLSALVVVSLLLLQLALARRSDPSAQDQFAQTFQPPGTVVAATTLLHDSLLDLKQNVPIITMNAPTSPDDLEARSLWDYALRQRSLLWFVTWFAPADSANWQERDLWQSAAFVTERELMQHRALLFDLSVDPVEQRSGWKFGQVALAAYGVRIRPDGVQVILRWSAARVPLPHLTWFVHLLDSAGTIVAQQDRQPLGGYAPTENWQHDTVVVDRLFFPLTVAPD